MIVLGISAYYHDSAAALVKDGAVIAAAAEERFNRIKHYNGFPVLACRYCLSAAGISIQDVDTVVFYEKPFLKFERIVRTHINYAPKGLRTFLSAMPIWLKERLNLRKYIRKEIEKAFHIVPQQIAFCEHHLSHAALAYCTSPYRKCAVLVLDAVGENATSSVIKASKDGLTTIKTQEFPHSLGLLYSSFTYFLGFSVNADEYKVMGLAPYGDIDSNEYRRYREIILNQLVKVSDDGSIELNDKYFTFMYADRMVNDRQWESLFGISRRGVKDQISDCHKNLALAIQQITEDIIVKMARYALEVSGERYLCIAGGCGLNSAAIGKLKERFRPNSLYVPFASGDDGAAIGCALYMSHRTSKKADEQQSPYLGPEYSDKEVKSVLDSYDVKYDYIPNLEKLCLLTSKEVSKGMVVGWFQGRMEFGPRALGNRSILADPRNPQMKEIISTKVKHREGFRPFAPAVLDKYSSLLFELKEESPYMVATYKVKTNVTDLPAVTHVDQTARVQTVALYNNERFYYLLRSFHEQTGCPVLLNTSFNVMGEPIVCSPEDAVKTFRSTGIDILVINNFIARKI